MATKKKMLQAAAGNAGGAGLDITDVFSTYLYEGTGSAQTITNGIDLDGEGGLVWFKSRLGAYNHWLFDTERGAGASLKTNDADAENPALPNSLSSFNSDGFSVISINGINNSGEDLASWTFRKAPKFFDVVTYTGTGVARTISHNLGSVPGCIIVKRTDTGGINWTVYHREMDANPTQPARYFLELNQTGARTFDESAFGTLPTDSVFTVGTDNSTNASGGTYVAYLFAHNDGDGGFGPNADQDIIKCGSLTTNSDGSLDLVDLGFEPQWLLIKNSSTTGNWEMYDVMRDGTLSTRLRANLADAEVSSSQFLKAEATGFSAIAGWGGASNTKIYMAIRRGPLAQPESGTEVFAIDTRSDATSNPPSYSANGIVDMALQKELNASGWGLWDRLRGQYRLQTHLTNAEDGPFSYANFDHMDGWGDIGATDTTHSWMWKRAPGFFDVVAYTGNGSGTRTVDHNLGVAPDMLWLKRRDGSSPYGDWYVQSTGISATNYLTLNGEGAQTGSPDAWSSTYAASDVFTVGPDNNVSGFDYITYLFATLPGVSKVGSYTGNGTSQTIDCGFTSGARFVLLKVASIADHWFLWDSVRGINAGTEPYLRLNLSAAEITTNDRMDPHSSGFAVDGNDTSNNKNGETYIFYAIA